MLKHVRTSELAVGMYIHVPAKWYEHPFLKSQFLLTASWQIAKLKESGIREVLVDTERGAASASDAPPPPEGSRAEGTRPPEAITVPAELLDAVRDPKLAPEKKAGAVYHYAMVMLDGVLGNPSAANIRLVKKGIAEVVDIILSDEATTANLLKITSYDFYTYTHSCNVGFLAVAAAKAVFRGSDGHDMHALGAGFFLHDLGKVRIDKEIINKPGRLTDGEMAQMRRHPSIGFKILHQTGQLTDECRLIVLQHHERFDGTGYPRGLRGNEIHVYGRLCSIADVYDALTSDRPYRRRLTPFHGLKIMKESMLHHFQKELFEQFVRLLT